MELLDLLRFLAPGLQSVSDDDAERALTLAVPYRPSCLTAEKADEAQVWYAAWILSRRVASAPPAEDDYDGQNIARRRAQGVKSEKEGDLQRTYSTASEMISYQTDPDGYLMQYQRLADLCRGGITVGHIRHG